MKALARVTVISRQQVVEFARWLVRWRDARQPQAAERRQAEHLAGLSHGVGGLSGDQQQRVLLGAALGLDRQLAAELLDRRFGVVVTASSGAVNGEGGKVDGGEQAEPVQFGR